MQGKHLPQTPAGTREEVQIKPPLAGDRQPQRLALRWWSTHLTSSHTHLLLEAGQNGLTSFFGSPASHYPPN